jgi:hypothetical protein
MPGLLNRRSHTLFTDGGREVLGRVCSQSPHYSLGKHYGASSSQFPWQHTVVDKFVNRVGLYRPSLSHHRTIPVVEFAWLSLGKCHVAAAWWNLRAACQRSSFCRSPRYRSTVERTSRSSRANTSVVSTMRSQLSFDPRKNPQSRTNAVVSRPQYWRSCRRISSLRPDTV